MNVRPRPRAAAITSRTSNVSSGSIEMPNRSMAPKINTRYTMLPTRINRGRRATIGFGSAGADNSHRSDLDRHRKGERARSDGGAGVAAGLPEHVDEQVGRRIQHLRLVPEITGRQY